MTNFEFYEDEIKSRGFKFAVDNQAVSYSAVGKKDHAINVYFVLIKRD